MIFLDAESRDLLKQIVHLYSINGVTRSETEILHDALKASVRDRLKFIPVDEEEPAEHSEKKTESHNKAGYTRKGRPVQVKYPDGHRKTFSSIKSAAEDTGLSKDRVKRMSLEGTQYKGFRVKSLAEPKTRRPRGIVIIDRYDRNIAFKSAEDAAAYIGVDRSALNKALYNGRSIAGYKVRAKNPREENLY